MYRQLPVLPYFCPPGLWLSYNPGGAVAVAGEQSEVCPNGGQSWQRAPDVAGDWPLAGTGPNAGTLRQAPDMLTGGRRASSGE